MSTATGDVGRRLVTGADEAPRMRTQARAAALVTFAGLALSIATEMRGDDTRTTTVAFAFVYLTALLAAGRALWHGYHYGHTQGRGSAIFVVLLASPIAPGAVWAAVQASGGRGAGRVRRITPGSR